MHYTNAINPALLWHSFKKGVLNVINKILVIGGAGKMGGWFVDFFRSQGFQTTVADATIEDGPGRFRNWTDAGVDYDVIVVATPLAVSPEAQVIEGDGPAPDVTVILTFPERDHALNWINDPEIAEVHARRRASGTSRILLM